MFAIDTNVFIYSVDATDLQKHSRALRFLEDLDASGESFVLLWQVACEFLANLNRLAAAGVIDAARVRAEFDAVRARFALVTPIPVMLSKSVDLRNRYSLSHWDSLLIAGCQAAGVDTVYSEDMSDGMTYDTVTVINPFKSH